VPNLEGVIFGELAGPSSVNARLDIGIILSSLGLFPGGLETMAGAFARGLAARGHAVTIVTGGLRGDRVAASRDLDVLRVPCVPLTSRWVRPLGSIRGDWPLLVQSTTFIAACRANPQVRARIERCAVTITFLEPETVAISQWRAAHGLPNISYFPGTIRSARLRGDKSALRFAASATLAAAYADRPEVPIHGVLYPGIDQGLASQSYEVKDTVRRAIFVGRLEPNKGIAILLELARNLASQRLELEIRLIGEGPLRADVQRQAARLGSVRIVCTGALPAEAVRAELSAADLFVFPSHYESFGVVVLEALAAGVPVICSDLPVLREVAGEAARFVPTFDAQHWTAAVSDLVGDSPARRELSTRGRARARQFSWDATMDQLEMHAHRVVLPAA
jgi:glycosyltransferase involved in cell wall biosynthesis